MTPETLRIDRQFRGVGRIKRASGTLIPNVRKKINKMLTDLYQNGRLDILRSIRDGHLSFMEALDAWTRKRLDCLPTGDTAAPLETAWNQWADSLSVPKEYSWEHVRSIRQSLRYFLKQKKDARVADLPSILDALRLTLGQKHPRSFNLARSHAQAFVRQTLKKTHRLWLEVAAVEHRKQSKKPKRRPLTPLALRGFFPNPDVDHVDALAWTMATTGMGQKELWGSWVVQGDRIHVEGTKREGRVRDIPLVWWPRVPLMHRRTFENKIRERTDGRLRPYDLRRSYANYLESSGIPRTRRRIYMGHGTKDITDLYETHEIAAFLSEDAAKMRAFLGLTSPESHTVRLVASEK